MTKLTESHLRSACSTQSFARGEEYYRSGAIFDTYRQGDALYGKCLGSSDATYHIRVDIDAQGIRSISCTCPYEWGGYCKHIVALLLTYIHEPGAFAERSKAETLLAGLTRDDLLALIQSLLTRYPDLYEWLEATVQTIKAKGTPISTRKPAISEQAYRKQVKAILHSLDDLSPSQAYWALSDMVAELDSLTDSARQFLDDDDPLSALVILMAVLEEVSQEYEMFDDSNGELAGFIDDLGLPIAEAILSAEMREGEIQDLANRLEDLYRHLSDYGVEGIGVALAAAHYGWQPAITLEDEGAEDKVEEEYDEELPDSLLWEQFLADLDEARLNVLERQGRFDEYLELCQRSSNPLRYTLKLLDLGRMDDALRSAQKLDSAAQALEVAERLNDLHRKQDAIQIAEQGLSLLGPKFELGSWLGPLEEDQGHNRQALVAYQAAFDEAPSLDLYRSIRRLAGPDWASLKPRLIEQMDLANRVEALVEILLDEGEWDSAIAIADQQASWNYRLVELVVDAVTPLRPDWAIQACRAQAEQLIDKKQSQYYAIAGRWLTKMKYAYTIQGRQSEWDSYLANLRQTYARRPALQSALKYL